MSQPEVGGEARHPEEWRVLLGEAVDAARQRDAALRAPGGSPTRARALLRALLLAIMFAGLGVLWVASRTISIALPPEKQAMDLAWLVRDAVSVVMARTSPGEPWPDEVAIDDLLPQALDYEVIPGGFRIIATVGEVRLEYESDQDPDLWVHDIISDGVIR